MHRLEVSLTCLMISGRGQGTTRGSVKQEGEK